MRQLPLHKNLGTALSSKWRDAIAQNASNLESLVQVILRPQSQQTSWCRRNAVTWKTWNISRTRDFSTVRQAFFKAYPEKANRWIRITSSPPPSYSPSLLRTHNVSLASFLFPFPHVIQRLWSAEATLESLAMKISSPWKLSRISGAGSWGNKKTKGHFGFKNIFAVMWWDRRRVVLWSKAVFSHLLFNYAEQRCYCTLSEKTVNKRYTARNSAIWNHLKF